MTFSLSIDVGGNWRGVAGDLVEAGVRFAVRMALARGKMRSIRFASVCRPSSFWTHRLPDLNGFGVAASYPRSGRSHPFVVMVSR